MEFSLGYALTNFPAQRKFLDIKNSNKLSSTSVDSRFSYAGAAEGLDFIETLITTKSKDLASEASIHDQYSLSKVSCFDKHAHLVPDLLVTSLKQSSSSLCVSSGTEDNYFLDVEQNSSHVTSSSLLLSEVQTCDSDHFSTKQQLKSLPSDADTCTQATNMVGDDPDVKLTSDVLNQQTLPVVWSTLSASYGSSCQISSSINELPKNAPNLNHQVLFGSHNIPSDLNVDQPLQGSQASAKISHLGQLALPDTTSFSKLLSNIKTLATQQRRSLGVGKTFPCLFGSFHSSIFKMRKHFPFLLPELDGNTCSEKLGTQQLMTSRCTQPYVPFTVDVDPQASAEELTNQGHLFYEEYFEKVGTRRFPTSQSSSNALPMRINTYPCNEFQAMPLIGSQGQAQEKCLMPTNFSTIPSVDHSYDQHQEKMTISDLHSRAISNPTCLSTIRKNEYINDIQFSNEFIISDSLGQQYPFPNQLVPVIMEKDNEGRNTISSDLGLRVNSNEQAVNPLSPLWQDKGVGTRSRAWWHMCSVDGAKIPPLPSCSQGSRGYGEEDPGQCTVGTFLSPLQKQYYRHVSDESSYSSSAESGSCQSESLLQKPVVSQLGYVIKDKLIALQDAEMYQGLAAGGISAVISSRLFIPGKDIQYWSPDTDLLPENKFEHKASTEISKVATSSNRDDFNHQNSSFLSNIGSPVTVLPKKRRRIVMPRTPSHIGSTEDGNRISTISNSEMPWTAARNSLLENEGDDSYVKKAGLVSQAKRRLLLTTQLMQQLVRPLPTPIMCGKEIVEYESVIYASAKTILEDACKFSSSLRISGNPNKFKRLKANSFSSEGKSFMGRTKGLENEFLRLETSMYISELRNEIQKLERLSVRNRFAKLRRRKSPVASEKSIANGTESLFGLTLSIHMTCPRRHATELPLPNDIPEGVLCCSL
ncbi:hypothetical protein SUGI_0636860 [Cryptomeria japonica]|nr:hypothetical protein SUGI_0636860 [Cryptomeria japonica]